MAITQGASGKYYCKIPGQPAKICIQDGQPTGATCNPLPPVGEQSCSYGSYQGYVVHSGSTRKKNGIFDYVVKQTVNGKNTYYGAFVEGDTERLVPIDQDTYSAMTGRRPVVSSKGVFRFYKPRLRGLALRSHIRQIAVDRGYGRNAIEAAVRLLPLLETALMDLEYKNVPVADKNNPFEVFVKYIYHNPQYRHIISNEDYQDVLKSIHGRNDLSFTDMFSGGGGSGGGESGGGGFDFGGMIGGLLGMFGELFAAGQSAATSQELGQWIAAYKNYMITDFGDIDRELREHGPRAALDWLERLKRTSWNDLKQYNIAWCQSHGVPVPTEVIQLQNAQKDLETTLRGMLEGGGQSNTTPNSDGTAPYSPPQNAGFGGNGVWLALGIGLIAVFLLKG